MKPQTIPQTLAVGGTSVGAAADTMPVLVLPPEQVEAEGGAWTVRRAWPGAKGELILELLREGTVRAARMRRGRIELWEPGRDPKLDALRPAAAHGRVISHRPGKRAVVRSADGSRYIKVVRPGRAPDILRGIGRARAFEGRFRMPRVLAGDDATVVFEALTGRSMHEPCAFTPAEWYRAWADVLGAWEETVRALPGTGTSAGGPEDPILAEDDAGSTGAAYPAQPVDVPVHGPAEEAAVLRRWTALAAPVVAGGDGQSTAGADGPEAGWKRFETAVERTAHRLMQLAVHRWAPAHRDLHDKQLLWDPELGPGLLDVDTACLADPALDLANLRAHALWRRRQGLWTAEDADVVLAQVDTTAARLGVLSGALAVYQEATLLRLGCVYAFRPAWAGQAAELRAELS